MGVIHSSGACYTVLVVVPAGGAGATTAAVDVVVGARSATGTWSLPVRLGWLVSKPQNSSFVCFPNTEIAGGWMNHSGCFSTQVLRLDLTSSCLPRKQALY